MGLQIFLEIYLINFEIAWNERSINTAETVWQRAIGVVATAGCIRIIVRIY